MLYGSNHYTEFSVQPIEAMKTWMSTEAYMGYLRGNVIKYIARYEKKNGVEDVKKAYDYLTELLLVLQEKESKK